MSSEIVSWLCYGAFSIMLGICLYSWHYKQQRTHKLSVYMDVVEAQRELLKVLILEEILPEKSTDVSTEQHNKIIAANAKFVVALAKLRNEI